MQVATSVCVLVQVQKLSLSFKASVWFWSCVDESSVLEPQKNKGHKNVIDVTEFGEILLEPMRR